MNLPKLRGTCFCLGYQESQTSIHNLSLPESSQPRPKVGAKESKKFFVSRLIELAGSQSDRTDIITVYIVAN